MIHTVRPQHLLMGRLRRGDDLLEALAAICVEKGVRLGRVEGLGAVERARVGYYDQRAREYGYLELDQGLEILSLVGNVSIREGEPMVHAHVVLGDHEGRAFGGHLAPGTKVFACEFVIDVLEGAELVRQYDDETGLPLWRPGSA